MHKISILISFNLASELNHDNLIALEKHFNLVTTLNELDYINDEDIFLKSIARVRSCLWCLL